MQKPNRQLCAIVFADIVGYSALVGTDEEHARIIRERHRREVERVTDEHGGRVVQYYGDGALIVFQSSVAAVESAVELQELFQTEPQVPMRVGIHTGDVTFDDEGVFGDGVNVASRLESVCPTGGILFSGKVFDDIKNHPHLPVKPLGRYQLKNIADPVSLFALSKEGLAVPEIEIWQQEVLESSKVTPLKRPRREKGPRRAILAVLGILVATMISMILYLRLFESEPADPLAAQFAGSKLSIAVLPFANFSEEDENDYFADGITEDILTRLAQIEALNVVSRTSVMQYKNTEKNARQIGEELRADYILEGSVRREDDQVRVVAQLIDAHNDKHLWAHTYDHKLTDIFALQSQVASDITGSLQMHLTPNQKAQLTKAPTKNPQAYDLYLIGREYYRKYTAEDNTLAIRLFRNALTVDPNFALAYAGMGDALAQDAFRYDLDMEKMDSAEIMSRKAIELDPQLSEGYKALGLVHQYRGEHEEAMDAYMAALHHNPNNEMAIANIATIFQDDGHPVEAIRWVKKALKIRPNDKITMRNLAENYQLVGLDREAIPLLQNCLTLYPDFSEGYQTMALLYYNLGAIDTARQVARQALELAESPATGHLILGFLAASELDFRTARTELERCRAEHKKRDEQFVDWGVEILYGYVLRRLNDPANSQVLQAVQKQIDKYSPIKTERDNHFFDSVMAAARGDFGRALEQLEQAAENNWVNYRDPLIMILFQEAEQSPRYQHIIEQVANRVNRLKQQVILLETGQEEARI